MLECVVNISEGRDARALALLARACGACLLDLHADGDHHRAVLTMAGDDEVVEGAVRDLARTAVSLLDLSGHTGVHPRFGVLDVVPWVALEGWPVRDAPAGAERARPPPRPLRPVGLGRTGFAGVPLRARALLA